MKFKSFEEIPNQETSEVVEETSTEKKEPTKESLPKQAGRVDRRGFEKSREEVFDKDELDKMSDAELAERAIFAAVENPTMGKEITRRVNQSLEDSRKAKQDKGGEQKSNKKAA